MNILNFFQYNDKLASGAQPNAEQITLLKEQGFEAIVNISTPSAKNALSNEAQMVEKLKMDYVHFPVDCSNLRPFHFETFKGIMNGLEGKKVFVHCGANIKSSNLLFMYHVLEKGLNKEASYKVLTQIQTPEAKWYSYFKEMGIN